MCRHGLFKRAIEDDCQARVFQATGATCFPSMLACLGAPVSYLYAEHTSSVIRAVTVYEYEFVNVRARAGITHVCFFSSAIGEYDKTH